MAEYQEYLVADLQTGLFKQKDRWLAPADAFPILQDAIIEDGVLKRRLGSSAFITPSTSGVVGLGDISYSGYKHVILCTQLHVYRLYPNGLVALLDNGEYSGTNFSGGVDDHWWFQEYRGSLYFCNGVDGIQKYTPGSGTPAMSAMNTGTVTIQTCRMLFTYKNRLIIVSPKIGGIWYPNYIYYTDVNLDNVGTTNFVKAQLEDPPVSGGYVGEVPVIFCRSGLIYHISYTQNADAPFTWEKRSEGFGSISRSGTVSIRNKLATMGLMRLAQYDGYEIQDYDLKVRGIIDDIDYDEHTNCFACKLKDREQIYIAYAAEGSTSHNRILVFNYADENFAVHNLSANVLFSLNDAWPSPEDRSWGDLAHDSDGTNLMIGESDGRLYISSNYGITWTEVQPAGDVDGVWEASASDSDGSVLLAASQGGYAYISTDSGATWAETQPVGGHVKRQWYCAESDSDGTNLIIGALDSDAPDQPGRLYISSNTGTSWTEVTPAGAADKDWTAVASDSDGSVLLAAEALGRLYLSTNSGSTWAEVQPAGDVNRLWTDIACDSDGSVIVAACSTGLYISTNSGSTWAKKQPASVDEAWQSCACDSDGSAIWAGSLSANGGRLYVSYNSGSTWSERQPLGDTDSNWNRVKCNTTGSKAVAVSSNYIHRGIDLNTAAPHYWWLLQPTPDTITYPISQADYQKITLAGKTDGALVKLNNTYQDEGVNIVGDIRSSQFNPFQKEGFQVKIGWVKFLLSAPKGEGISVSFYKDDSATAFKTVQIDSPGTTKTWQTAWLDGEVGDFFTMKIVDTYQTGINASGDSIRYAIMAGMKKAGPIRNRYQYAV